MDKYKKRFVIRSDSVAYRISGEVLSLPTDGTVEVLIRTLKTTRSIEQNKLYWMWIGILCEELGYTKDAMHDAVREELLAPVFYKCIRDGKERSRLRSTTELSVKEFSAYLEAFEQFAAGFAGCVLPRPEEQYEIAMGYRRVEAKTVHK